MILLDTDHLSALVDRRHFRHAKLRERIQGSIDQDLAIPIVSVEEQLRGWLAQIHRLHDFSKQVSAYDRLARLIDFLSHWQIVPFDYTAAEHCQVLRRLRIRIGSQDLKIAAIAIINDALLLSANLRDFRQVPELTVENWLE
jgi:tRNA(fMet)-specific endonuclease VapC